MIVKYLKQKFRHFKYDRKPRTWVRLQNTINRARKNRITYSIENDLFLARGPELRIWFASQKRAVLLNDGIERRLQSLAQAYMLNDIQFNEGDVVVDVGANIGEIGMWLNLCKTRVKYIAFEPSLIEFCCLCRNVENGEAHNTGVWRRSEPRQFFVSSDEADSSFLKPKRYRYLRNVQCYRLDDILAEPSVKLLKVDAEGAEPEVLIGADSALRQCKYVVVDAGPERGEEEAITAPDVINYMLSIGFDVDRVDRDRMVFRFIRREHC